MEPIELAVPYGETVLVEYPAFVENPDAAIATLGGPDAVRAALFGADAKQTELALRFRPADPLAHPILADRSPTDGLLLRITKRPGQAQCSAEVAARVTSTYQFQGPADMQYVSADTGVSPPQAGGNPAGWDAEPLLAAPPFFLRASTPRDYAYHSFHAADPDQYKTGLGGSGAGRLVSHSVSFEDPTVPQPLPGTEPPTKDRRALAAAVTACFAERPVWSLPELQHRLAKPPEAAQDAPSTAGTGRGARPGAAAKPASRPAPGQAGAPTSEAAGPSSSAADASSKAGASSPTVQELHTALQRLAYIFRSGPWRDLWVKRGYDPRSDPGSAQWQALRLPAAQPAPGAGDAAKPSMAAVLRLEALPSTETAICIGGLLQPALQQSIATATPQDDCTAASGWWAPTVMELISATLERVVLKLHRPGNLEAAA